MPLIWFKLSNYKTPQVKTCRIVRQSVTKIMSKTVI